MIRTQNPRTAGAWALAAALLMSAAPIAAHSQQTADPAGAAGSNALAAPASPAEPAANGSAANGDLGFSDNAVARGTAIMPVGVNADASPRKPLDPATCEAPLSHRFDKTAEGVQLVFSPVCDKARVTLKAADGGMTRPNAQIVDNALRVDMPCGRQFTHANVIIGFSPLNIHLERVDNPCGAADTRVASVVPLRPDVPEVAASGCAASFAPQVAGGILTAGFTGCTTGEKLSLTYQNTAFSALADASGNASVQVPLMEADATITAPDGTEHAVRWPEAASTLRLALVWEQPVDMDLHVLTPGAPTFDSIQPAHANGRTLGQERGMSVTDTGGEGVNFEVFDSPRNGAATGLGAVYVSNVSRGEVPSGAFCGDGLLAASRFTVMIGGAEKAQAQAFALGGAKCDTPLSVSQYYRRIEDIRPFW